MLASQVHMHAAFLLVAGEVQPQVTREHLGQHWHPRREADPKPSILFRGSAPSGNVASYSSSPRTRKKPASANCLIASLVRFGLGHTTDVLARGLDADPGYEFGARYRLHFWLPSCLRTGSAAGIIASAPNNLVPPYGGSRRCTCAGLVSLKPARGPPALVPPRLL